MGSTVKWSAAVLCVAAALGVGANAEAGTIYCPGTVFNIFDREFALTTAASAACVDSGVGNFENASDGEATYLAAGWASLDKTADGGGLLNGALGVSNLNGSSGTFSIATSVWDLYSDVLFVMKSGGGTYDPDWAVFDLATGTTGGSWSIGTLFGNANGLSHVNIYGRGASTQVAEPATWLLMGTGLMGALAMRRRRAKQNV